MKKIFLAMSIITGFITCSQKNTSNNYSAMPDTSFNKMLDDYYEQRMKLYPLEATQNGDNRYNDQLPGCCGCRGNSYRGLGLN
ncbi:MAG: hypothetical protein JWN83_490 [Chitinophagaceae bacterium]|nr:hypothetical protein [Chitinophagaceae bacterium]